PYEGSGILHFSGDAAIPTLSCFRCTEHQLTPTVVDSEKIQLRDAYRYWSENIITISPRAKRIGNKNIGIGFKDLDVDGIVSFTIFRSISPENISHIII